MGDTLPQPQNKFIMSYNVISRKYYADGTIAKVVEHTNTFVVSVFKTGEGGVITELCWKYEAKSLGAITKWVNKVRKTPIPNKYFESGIDHLPHNEGFGNPDGKRRSVSYD